MNDRMHDEIVMSMDADDAPNNDDEEMLRHMLEQEEDARQLQVVADDGAPPAQKKQKTTDDGVQRSSINDPLASSISSYDMTDDGRRIAIREVIALSKPRIEMQVDSYISSLEQSRTTHIPVIGDPAKVALDMLWQRWFPDWIDMDDANPKPDMTSSEMIADVMRIFGLTDDMLNDQKAVEQQIGFAIQDITSVLTQLQSAGLMGDRLASKQIRMMLDKANVSKYAIQALLKYREVVHSATSDAQAGGLALWRFLDIHNHEQKPNTIQQIVLQAITEAARLGYRRYSGYFYEPVRNKEGLLTCAWQCVISISDFLWKHTEDTTAEDGMWFNLSRSPKNAERATEFLTHSREWQIPDLRPDRHAFSFNNGVYLAKQEIFVLYSEIALRSSQNSFPVACKHFDMDFNPDWVTMPDYIDIPTPAFDKICHSQHLSPTMVRWFFTMIGRSMYDIKELDDWQVMLFIKGIAGTGKSNIMNYVLQQFYEKTHVGIISNNIEEKFGLGTLVNNFVVLMDDIRENFRLDQSDFQNMISGMQVSCPVKNGQPIVKKWTAPLVGSGNEIPKYRDNSGSIGRRMFIVPFKYVVESPDGMLSEKLMQEMAAMICKSNRAYRNTLRRIGSRSFWQEVPPEALEERKIVTSSSNYLSNFLTSGAFVFGKEHRMPLGVFRKKSQEHAVRNSFKPSRWVPDFYQGPFSMHRLSIERCTRGNRRTYHGNACVDLDWVVGCDIPEDTPLSSTSSVFSSSSASSPLSSSSPSTIVNVVTKAKHC